MSFRSTLKRLASSVVRGGGGRGGRSQGRGGSAEADAIRIAYTPDRDGEPDPGEVVWTWVPYEEDPNQGKDRPVVVIGSIGARLAVVPLTSRSPEGRDPSDWVSVGTGDWDPERRASFANVERVLQVVADDVRREGATLDHRPFDAVVAAVARRHPTVS